MPPELQKLAQEKRAALQAQKETRVEGVEVQAPPAPEASEAKGKTTPQVKLPDALRTASKAIRPPKLAEPPALLSIPPGQKPHTLMDPDDDGAPKPKKESRRNLPKPPVPGSLHELDASEDEDSTQHEAKAAPQGAPLDGLPLELELEEEVADEAGTVVGLLPADKDFQPDDTRIQLPDLSEPTPQQVEHNRLLDRYRDLGLLARGGMSYIHKVFDQELLRQSAMKLISPKMAAEARSMRRFLQEAQITGQLEHPNIVPVHEMGTDGDGHHYFTMKLVKGETLKEFLHADKFDNSSESDLYQALQIFLKVCDALSFAHSRGVIHRDLKPSNIMVGDHGQVYLMDWGIACLLGEITAPDGSAIDTIQIHRDISPESLDRTGAVIGSLRYIAPEQAHGDIDRLDERTDIFALGAILYEILTLTPPYTGNSYYGLLDQAKDCDITPPQERAPGVHLPRELCNIAAKALRPNPDERYQSVHELKTVIERFLHGDGRFPRKTFPAGTIIIHEGAQGDTAYGIIRGHCQVYKTIDGQRMQLRRMGPGEVFGEAAILTSEVRTASVEAIDEVTVMMIPRDILNQELGFESWMGRLVKNLADRFNELDRKIVQVRQDLRRSQLINCLLTYIHLFGHTRDETTQSASWSLICLKVCAKTGIFETELIAFLEKIELFDLDIPNDTISVENEQLAHYLEEKLTLQYQS